MAAKKILIVEDNDLNLKLFSDILGNQPEISLVTHREGRDAYEKSVKESPDLIIMDIQLPHVSGIDIIRMLKENSDYKHIPIFAITAYAMEDDEEKVRKAGCDEYLPKPISIIALTQLIESYLNIKIVKPE